MKGKLALLFALAAVAAAAFYARRAKVPGGAAEPGPAAAQADAATGSPGAAPGAAAPSDFKRIHDDGSFNPLSSMPDTPESENPATMPAAFGWRERYAPALAATLPGGPGPAIYVYPFLDATARGVGVNCTYGSHLLGAASLALRTNARIAGFHPPQGYGIESDSAEGKPWPKTWDEWKARALADPACKDAQILVIGAFEDAPGAPAGGSRLRLAIRSVEREGGRETLLFEGVADRPAGLAPWRGFEIPAKLQRDGIIAATRKLAEGGPLAPRKETLCGMDLRKELDGVAELLAKGDSWRVMDGIDRALQLADLFPENTAALQAASYGLNQLSWMMFDYTIGSPYYVDYSLRAYALAQLAAAQDPQPGMTHLNWLCGCRPLGHLLGERKTALTGADHTVREVSMIGYYHLVFSLYETFGDRVPLGRFPAWQVLAQEGRTTRMFGKSPYRPQFTSRLSQAADNDFFAMAAVRDNTEWKYQSSGIRLDDGIPLAARIATAQSLAQEFAALAVALKGTPEQGGMIAETLAEFPTPEGKALSAEAAKGDYHSIRAAALKAFDEKPATDPKKPDPWMRKTLATLGAMSKRAGAVMEEPRQRAAASGFAGFEFTPAERLRFASRRGMVGPSIGNELYDAFPEKGGPAEFLAAIRAARPGDAFAAMSAGDILDNMLGSRTGVDAWMSAVADARAAFPLDPDLTFRAARTAFYNGDLEEGKRRMILFSRLDPFSASRISDAADLLLDYGYRAEGVKLLETAIKAYPERYDLMNRRRWALCQMGKWEDPEFLAGFKQPVETLPGNPTFVIDLLDYLEIWMKDYDGAREAARKLRKLRPNEGIYRLFWIEMKTERKEEARSLLGELSPEKPNKLEGQNLAAYHADLARAYIALGDLDKAAQETEQTEKIAPEKQTAILARASLEASREKWEAALGHWGRALEKFWASDDALAGASQCLEKLGKRDDAILLLEPYVLAKRYPSIGLAPKLMRLYGEAGKKEPAKRLMERVARHTTRYRATIYDTAEAYKKLDAKAAEDVIKRIDEIMAGPAVW